MLRMLISSYSATKRRHVLPFNQLWTICQCLGTAVEGGRFANIFNLGNMTNFPTTGTCIKVNQN